MVEDALKSTRNLERLLLLASLIALVFLSSFDDPTSARERLYAVQDIRNLGSSGAYAQDLRKLAPHRARREQFVERFHSPVSAPVTPPLGASDKACEFKLTDVGAMAAVLSQALHTERARPEELTVGEPSMTLAEARKQIESLPDQDALFSFVDPVAAADTVYEAIQGQPANCGKEPIVVEILDAEVEHVSVAEGRPYAARVSFRTRVGGAPRVHRAGFAVREVILEESSFERWLLFNQPSAFLLLMDPPSGFDQHQPLAEVQEKLEERVRTGMAEGRTINLLGLSLPGSLALYGIPLVLVGLTGLFLLHLAHLRRLGHEHGKVILEFVWAPLTPGRVLWLAEMSLVVIILPVLAQALLVTRVYVFNPYTRPSDILYGFLLGGGFVSLGLGVASIYVMWRLRQKHGLS